MGGINMDIPNCVPEYYRQQEEREEHEYEQLLKRNAYYEESKSRLERAKRCGQPILNFGGYNACYNCKKKFDVQIDAEDDFCTIICYDKNCVCHKKG